MLPIDYIKKIVHLGSNAEKIALYSFNAETKRKIVLKKFKIFVRANYIRYISSDSPDFHDEMVLNMIRSYRGQNFINLAFRGCSKTSLAKLFIAFVLLNDQDHFRRYIKINSRDIKNPKQIVTDVYNMMLELAWLYGDVFQKEGDRKREERMDSFTLKSGVKLTAGTVGQTQRGHLQDAYRPDWELFDDIEDRESISSQAITESIIGRCDEAIAGLSKNGSWMVLGNYISEYGVIQWFINKGNRVLMITPIEVEGIPTWPEMYDELKIAQLRRDADDFYGEYMCDPTRSEGKFFDIDRIEKDLKNAKEPISIIGQTKYWNGYLSHHRYGIGADTSEGVKLDSCALANFDFVTGELVSTYHSNTIKPELFAYELKRVGDEYGSCMIAPEINNMSGGIVIITLKSMYENIFQHIDRTKIKETESLKLGWHTNSRTKPQMFMDFRRDYNDGIVHIYDKQVLIEMKTFTDADLVEAKTTGKITRHFDLLTAVVIAWQMKSNLKEAKVARVTYAD